MTTIKSYTDIFQSKTLSKILPLESADMNYWCGTQIRIGGYRTMDKDLDVPCWSLAALLSVIPNPIICTHFVTHKWEGESYKVVNHQDGLMEIEQLVSTEGFDNPVDACYEMIIHLNELNLL